MNEKPEMSYCCFFIKSSVLFNFIGVTSILWAILDYFLLPTTTVNLLLNLCTALCWYFAFSASARYDDIVWKNSVRAFFVFYSIVSIYTITI